MRDLHAFALPAFAACLWLLAAAADEAGWQAHMDMAQSAFGRAAYGEAAQALRRAVQEAEELGAATPELAESLDGLSVVLQKLGRYDEAANASARALAIYPQTLGPQHPLLATAHANMAALHFARGRYAEAEVSLKRALEIRKAAFGAEDPSVARTLNSLAELYRLLGRYGEARDLLEQALAVFEQAGDAGRAGAATSLNNLGILAYVEGRYKAAEARLWRALALREAALGKEHPDVAQTLHNLAAVNDALARHEEAEPLSARALAIDTKMLGPEHPEVGTDLLGIAERYRAQGRYAEAEPRYQRAIAIFEKAFGADHLNVAKALNNLGLLYEAQGRYAEAEPLYRRSLVIRERALGTEHADVATALSSLGMLYQAQGRYGEAEPLLQRTLALDEKLLGPEHEQVAVDLNNLAMLRQRQGRWEEAERRYRRSLEIRERALGATHPAVATALNNLAALYDAQGRSAQAEPLLRRAISVYEQALGTRHPDVARALNNLAALYEAQGRYLEAERLYRRALTLSAQALGGEHPEVASSAANLAGLQRQQGRLSEALALVRRSSAIHRARTTRVGTQRSTGALSEQRNVRAAFLRHVQIIADLLAQQPEGEESLVAEGFEVVQLAKATGTANALARMTARFAAGDDELAVMVRRAQDRSERWRTLDRALVRAAGRPSSQRDPEREARLRTELHSVDAELTGLRASLDARFPRYKELVSAEPFPQREAARLLAPGEALVTYLVGEEGSFLWVVRPEMAGVRKLGIGRHALEQEVGRLRQALQRTGGERGVTRRKEHGAGLFRAAHGLYLKVLAPAEPLLDGVQHILVVPDGALTGIPLAALVSEPPKLNVGSAADLAGVAWLAKRYAFTVLPSSASLRALRRAREGSPARKPFIGFGDPLFAGTAGEDVAPAPTALFRGGGLALVSELRKLARLPETEDELRAIARSLGAQDTDLHLRHFATEARVKSMPLSAYRIVAFATHGLMAGEFSGLAEPALALTPPDTGTTQDDGLLTASEVAGLELNADWVVLSACNTAAADGTPGAEGLSGLAKAFIYAGSRSLLVSHWAVDSQATVALTTGLFRILAEQPGIGRAEALRRAGLLLMADPRYAHPAYWAPFVVVGEGGPPR